MEPITKILAPLDCTEQGERAVGSIVGLARALDAEVTFLSVVDEPANEAREYLGHLSERMRLAGVKARTSVASGEPAEEIVRFADEDGSDLIAMATRRGSSAARVVLGSVTDRVLHLATVPVMAVHLEKPNPARESGVLPDSIIVPLDGSERSSCVVDLALEIARAADVEIVFVSVDPHPYYGVYAINPAFSHLSVLEKRQEAPRRQLEQYLAPFLQRAEEMGVRSRTVTSIGAPAASLIEETKAHSHPLLIMSTSGKSGLKRWLAGSVTDKVIRASGAPVIAVAPPASAGVAKG